MDSLSIVYKAGSAKEEALQTCSGVCLRIKIRSVNSLLRSKFI